MNTPDQYGVVGHPISHSWSPFIHGLFAKQTDQSLVYRLYDIAPGNFRAQVLEFFTRGGRGLNVTVPHKEAAAELANELTARADRAGAVNTLVLSQDHTLLGDNTDGHGLVTDLRKNLGLQITNERLLILGAGGATRGVVEPLLAMNPVEVVIANRTPQRAINLASLFADLGAVRGCGFEDVGDEPFDIVINATAAGLSGSVPNVDSSVIAAHTVCYDMSYSKSATPFVTWAIEQGCARAHKGWGMLVEQAAESFTLWRGVRPDTEPVLAALGMK
ncbi:MAG TPA: shikimate dehydrogenase [Steroidobacteraceae bacterium]|nr:shikimate dehydrogenase [Steroidobacteraceae bacterium]